MARFTSSTHRRRAAVLAVLAVPCLGLGLSSCSGNASASGTSAPTTTAPPTTASPTTSTSPSTTTTTVPVPKRQYVTIGGRKIKVPLKRRHFPIQTESGQGQDVIIWAHSFAPRSLYARTGNIIFTNLTDSVETVSFVGYPSPADPLVSGPIPPGGTYTLHQTGKNSGLVAITYKGSNGATAYLNVNTVPGL